MSVSPSITSHRPATCRPWAEVATADLRHVVGVLTDIDDTLTTHGAITPEAQMALTALRDAGLPVFAITGRPMGWSEPHVKAWPVNAIVAENGAVALYREGDRLLTDYVQDEATRQRNAQRLHAAAQDVLCEVPGTMLSRDSAGRVTDIAIDHSEFAHLSEAQIEHVVRVMQRHGMSATVSSIHINGWFGDHTKLSGARWIVRQRLGRSLEAETAHWIYVGDSTNDQLMFGHFPLSVGVANLMDFAERLSTWPAFITQGARGHGFAEVARTLLVARGATVQA
jgi:HAD superfamily hydrolase (TIGR01484 family)